MQVVNYRKYESKTAAASKQQLAASFWQQKLSKKKNLVGPLTNCKKKKLRLTFSGFQPPLKIDDVAFEMRQGVGLLIKCLSMLPTHYKRCAKNCHESFRAETHPLWHFSFRKAIFQHDEVRQKNKMESFFSSQNITTAKA